MRFDVTRIALSAATAALLASCGGGGGGGSTPPIDTGPQAIAISAANSKTVAADALDVVRNTSATSGPASLPLSASIDAQPSVATMPAMLAAARMAVAAPRGTQVPMGMMATQTVACPLGGTMMMSGNFATTAGTSPGDNFTITATGCTVSDGGATAVMNGQMSITIVSGAMDTMPFHIVLQVNLSNLSLVSASVTTVASGDARFDWNAMTTMSQTMMSTGTSMTTRETIGGTTRTKTMTNYAQGISLNGTIVSGTLSATVETGHPMFGAGGGIYTVTTPAPVVWDAATGVVSAGSIRVVGAANSQLMMSFTGAGNATIALDANGDGTVELTTPTTVAELDSLR